MATELKIMDPAIEPEMQEAKTIQAANLDVIIVDDETYKTVKATWQVVRSRRLDWEKKVNAALKSAKIKLQDWKTKADEVTEVLSDTEGDLRQKMQQYDDEKKAEKEREERERHERFIAKTSRLFEAGFAYNGVYYVAGTIIATPQQIEEASDEDFEAMLNLGKAEADNIKEALAEIAKRKAEEDAQSNANVSEVNQQVTHTPFVLPVPDDEILVEFEEVPRKPVSEYRDPSFMAGFDACKNMVIDILENSAPMTRSELRQKISDLQAYKSMPDMVKYE